MMKEKKIRHRLFVFQRIIASRIYRLLGPLNIHLKPKTDFCIKAGYHHAMHAETFDDRQNKDEWQRTVYESALAIFKKSGGETVIDLGCGSAYKLMEMFGNNDTLGIELSDTFDWLMKNYPSRKWLAFENTDPSQLEADLVVCSDVIEHIKNPDEIMDFLKKMKFGYLIISTPERDNVRGKKDFGPPENTAHYREWNGQEFMNYISKWFEVQEQIISKDKSASQILICKNA
jgi:hypothetical protein